MTPEQKLTKHFSLFLTLLWKSLGLPPPTRAQIAMAHYLQYGPKQGPPAPKAKAKSNPYKQGTFKAAFKEARNKGKKEFTWNGKRYNTKLKS